MVHVLEPERPEHEPLLGEEAQVALVDERQLLGQRPRLALRGEDRALEVAGAIVTYEQALRFLTDWLLGDVYYRINRPDQNRDRARAQLALLTSLQGTVRS